jgi:hypothetical protein
MSPTATTTSRFDLPSRLKIGETLAEIARRAQADVARDEFFAEFLTQVIAATGAGGGAVWMLDQDEDQIHPLTTNFLPAEWPDDSEALARHAQVVRQALAAGMPAVIGPHSEPDETDLAHNPTPYILLLLPLRTSRRLCGIVELFQRPGEDGHLHDGCFRFL